MIQFDLPKEKSSIIKVFGIGGGGSNAVTYMYKMGIQGVNYVICNTDNQALEMSDVPNKIQLGSSLREGLGAGSKPEIGREATEEAIDNIEEILQTNTKMVFITAGMGGGTGTGGAPVVARLAKDMGILTVAIVTTPFSFEGKKRLTQAEAGIMELKKEVDALLVISNDKLREIHGNLRMSEAFAKADGILTVAAKGIAEIITKIGIVNVDFEDVNTVMRDSGVAMMGIGIASGENRAIVAVEEAMSSPLLNDNNITGAKSVLLNLSYGKEELTMDETGEITDYISEEIGTETENLIWGFTKDDSLEDEVRVTLIATGFESNEQREKKQKNKKVVHQLEPVKVKEKATESPKKEESDQDIDETKPFLKSAMEQDTKPVQITFDFNTKREASSQKEKTKRVHFVPLENEENDEEQIEEVEASIDQYQPVSNAQPVTNPFTLHQNTSPEAPTDNTSNNYKEQEEQNAEHIIKNTNDERIKRLQSFSLRMKKPGEVDKLESQPAYIRKQIELEETPKSSERTVSRFQLSQNEEGEIEITKNTYLHDNVD